MVKIKVNSIAQVLFAPTAVSSSFDLKTLYILSSACTGCLKIKAKKNLKKKVLSNNMKHSVYLLLYKLRDQNPQTRQQQQTSSCSFSFFLFFFLRSFFSQFTIHNVLCSQCTEGQFCFFGTPCMFCRNLRTSKQQQQQCAIYVVFWGT